MSADDLRTQVSKTIGNLRIAQFHLGQVRELVEESTADILAYDLTSNSVYVANAARIIPSAVNELQKLVDTLADAGAELTQYRWDL